MADEDGRDKIVAEFLVETCRRQPSEHDVFAATGLAWAATMRLCVWESNLDPQVFFDLHFYRAMLCVRDTSRGPVSVSLSVC